VQERGRLAAARKGERGKKIREWVKAQKGERAENAPARLTAEQRELRVRSMKELVWRAERLGYTRHADQLAENAQDLIHFITDKTQQHVMKCFEGLEEGEKEAQKKLFAQSCINPNPGDTHALTQGIARLTQLKIPLPDDKRYCVLCCDIFKLDEGLACVNAHFACLDCHRSWLSFELNEARVTLRCAAIVGCPCLYHPTTFFALIKDAELKKKWENTTLQMWRKNAGLGSLKHSLGKDSKPDEEVFVDCVNCDYYECATVGAVKQLGGIWECQACNVISCHLCQPVVRIADNQVHYLEVSEKNPHEHVLDNRFIWRSIVENIITTANIPACPGCRMLIAKEVGGNAMKCSNCETRFCFACSTRLPPEALAAHDSFNEETHHNPALLCQLFEDDTEAYREKACKEILKAFVSQKKCTKEELSDYCADLLADIGFFWPSEKHAWWHWWQ